MLYPANSTIGSEVLICGIDPGSHHLGFSIVRIDLKDFRVVSIWAETLNLDRLTDVDSIIRESHNDRTAKIYTLSKTLVRLFHAYKPAYICCESPFYHHLRPAAFGSLVEVIGGIRIAAIEYNCTTPFITYEPSTIKKAIGANAIADKLAVKVRLATHPALQGTLEMDFNQLDEHALDAIAVCLTHVSFLALRG